MHAPLTHHIVWKLGGHLAFYAKSFIQGTIKRVVPVCHIEHIQHQAMARLVVHWCEGHADTEGRSAHSVALSFSSESAAIAIYDQVKVWRAEQCHLVQF
jgi:hypothetical protein